MADSILNSIWCPFSDHGDNLCWINLFCFTLPQLCMLVYSVHTPRACTHKKSTKVLKPLVMFLHAIMVLRLGGKVLNILATYVASIWLLVVLVASFLDCIEIPVPQRALHGYNLVWAVFASLCALSPLMNPVDLVNPAKFLEMFCSMFPIVLTCCIWLFVDDRGSQGSAGDENEVAKPRQQKYCMACFSPDHELARCPKIGPGFTKEDLARARRGAITPPGYDHFPHKKIKQIREKWGMH